MWERDRSPYGGDAILTVAEAQTTATVERYVPGEEATEFVPGDFILTRIHRVDVRFISWAQKRRFKGAEAVYAYWSHAAVIVGNDGALVEAETFGVVRSPISKYRSNEYHLVRIGPQFTPEARSKAQRFAEAQVGQAFGYLDMLGATFYLLFGWPLHWVRRNHEMCSSLVVKALQSGGLLKGLDPALTFPADLARIFDAGP